MKSSSGALWDGDSGAPTGDDAGAGGAGGGEPANAAAHATTPINSQDFPRIN